MDPALLVGRGELAPHRDSVLPRIAATATAEGTRLTVVGAGSNAVWRLVGYAAMAVTAFAVPVLAHKVAQGMRAFTFGISVGLMFMAALSEYIRWHRLRRATLVVRPWPIKLEAPTEARFRIFMRDGAPVSSLAAKLECVEEVAIGTGRDAAHRKSSRYEMTLGAEGDHQASKHHLTATWSFTVPKEHPPSFDVKSNQVVWRLTATVTTDGVEIPVVFPLLVVPEIAG